MEIDMSDQSAPSADDLVHWKQREKSKLDKEIHECMILHDKFRIALDLIDEVRSNIGTRNERLGLLIFGRSRSGKSRLLEFYRDSNPEKVDNEGNRIRPVVLISLDNVRTSDDLCRVLLAELGDVMSNRGTSLDRVRRVQEYLARYKVEVVLIDEAQHVVSRGQAVTLQATADFVKGLIERTRIAYVLAGVAAAGDFFMIDEQIRNRFMTPVELRIELSHDSTVELDGVKGILTLIYKLQEKVAFFGRSDLYNLGAGSRLCLATDGRIGKILDLLQDAGKKAIADRRDSVTQKDLAQAYTALIGDPVPGVGNPFTASASDVAIALENRKPTSAFAQSTNRRIRANKRQVRLADVVKQ